IGKSQTLLYNKQVTTERPLGLSKLLYTFETAEGLQTFSACYGHVAYFLRYFLQYK
ncbi:hypothetical protein J6590_095379, partial [Homalodisca vitripennis]